MVDVTAMVQTERLVAVAETKVPFVMVKSADDTDDDAQLMSVSLVSVKVRLADVKVADVAASVKFGIWGWKRMNGSVAMGVDEPPAPALSVLFRPS